VNHRPEANAASSFPEEAAGACSTDPRPGPVTPAPGGDSTGSQGAQRPGRGRVVAEETQAMPNVTKTVPPRTDMLRTWSIADSSSCTRSGSGERDFSGSTKRAMFSFRLTQRRSARRPEEPGGRIAGARHRVAGADSFSDILRTRIRQINESFRKAFADTSTRRLHGRVPHQGQSAAARR